MVNAKVRQTDEAGLMGGIQSMPSKKEGINQGWPIKEFAEHKKSLWTIKRVRGPEEIERAQCVAGHQKAGRTRRSNRADHTNKSS
jgi:hypothetical protein